METPAKIAQ